jgi:hypothetical protein
MEANRRIRKLWVLVLTVALVASITGTICWGIYLGDRYREPVLSFERDFLGMKIAAGLPLAPAPSVRPAQPLPSRQRLPGDRTAPAAAASPPPAAAAPPPAASPPPAAAASAPSTPGRPVPETDPDRFRPPPTPPTAAADPTVSFNVPITVRAKVLVDERYANANVDWISLVQRTMSAAAHVYRDNFGIDISLIGVVKWNDALEGLTIDALHANLYRHPREGADVLLGFVADQLNAYGYIKSAPPVDSPLNGAYGLVGVTPGSEPAHLRGVLRSIGHLLGAQAVIDPNSEAYRFGSWMSVGPVIPGRGPWIDLENRKRILQHKGRPYLPEGGT